MTERPNSAHTGPKTPREPPICFRLPQALAARFNEEHAASGLSRSAFIISRLFGHGRHDPGLRHLLGQLLAALADIADALREVAAAVRAQDGGGDDRTAAALADIRAELAAIRAALMQALGRKP